MLLADKKLSIKLSDIEDVLADLCSFVIAATEEIGAEEMPVAVKSITTCCVKLVASLASIVAEHDSRNDGRNDSCRFHSACSVSSARQTLRSIFC